MIESGLMKTRPQCDYPAMKIMVYVMLCNVVNVEFIGLEAKEIGNSSTEVKQKEEIYTLWEPES